MDCFGTYLTHAQSCDNVHVHSATAMDCFGTYFTHAQSCDNVHVQSAASVRTGLLRCILYTCPKL